MALSPEEIEARRFRLAQNGYDCESVDRFLAEIAEAFRAPATAPDGADEFGRLGQEIAAILRNARDSAGAVRAEAEGHAAAVRSRAEAEAEDQLKAAETEAETRLEAAKAEAERQLEAAETEAEAVRTRAGAQADELRSQARAEAETLRTAAQADADEIRLEAERQLEAATLARARADEQVAAAQANAEREAAAKLERAEHEARRLADEITAEATQRAEALHESEQSTYLRLLAARDDLQQAIDRLVAGLEAHDPDSTPPGRPADDQTADPAADDSVVDLTTAPPQVHPEPGARRRPRSAGGPSPSHRLGWPRRPQRRGRPPPAHGARRGGASLRGLEPRRSAARGVGLLSQARRRRSPSEPAA